MTVEFIGRRGFRRINLAATLESAKIQFSRRAPYVEYSDNGVMLGYTLQNTPDVLQPMFAGQLQRERI